MTSTKSLSTTQPAVRASAPDAVGRWLRSTSQRLGAGGKVTAFSPGRTGSAPAARSTRPRASAWGTCQCRWVPLNFGSPLTLTKVLGSGSGSSRDCRLSKSGCQRR